MARNCQLKNLNGINVYPKTYAKNVYLNNGKTLEDMLDEILNGNYIVFEPYQPKLATRYSSGEVIIGKGLSVDENGVISVSNNSVNGVFDLTDIYENKNAKKINISDYMEV